MTSPESSSMRWVVLGVSTFSFLILMVNFSTYPIVSLEMSQDMGLTYTQVGFLMSVFSIFYAIAQIPAGATSDKVGGSRVASISVTVMGAAGILFALSPSYVLAVLARIILGFSGGFLLPATMKLLPKWFTKEEYNNAMGVYGTGQGMAFLLTFLSVPAIVSQYRWRWGLLYASILTIVAMCLSWIFVREARQPEITPHEKKGFKLSKVTTKQLIILTSFNFTAVAVFTGIITWAPKFLTEAINLPLVEVGYISAMIGVMNILGSYFSGVLSKKIPNNLIVVISMVMCVMMPVLLSYAKSPIFAFLVISLIGWATMFYFAPTFGSIPSAVESRYLGVAFGVFNTISFIGSSLTPFIGGLLLDYTGRFDLVFLSISVIALFGLMCSLRFKG